MKKVISGNQTISVSIKTLDKTSQNSNSQSKTKISQVIKPQLSTNCQTVGDGNSIFVSLESSRNPRYSKESLM